MQNTYPPRRPGNPQKSVTPISQISYAETTRLLHTSVPVRAGWTMWKKTEHQSNPLGNLFACQPRRQSELAARARLAGRASSRLIVKTYED